MSLPIAERLLRKHQTGVTQYTLVNPDGPEAAEIISELHGALAAVKGAMLVKYEGEDFGWSITKLNKARPQIRAALAKAEGRK